MLVFAAAGIAGDSGLEAATPVESTGTVGTAASAEAVLLDNLRSRFPAVTRWVVKPFGEATPPAGGKPRIELLGPRSAVRVGTRVYWYSVEGFETVVSAARRISAGEALSSSAGREEERDVLASRCDPLTSATQLNGARATRFTRRNELMCVQTVEARPPVARGDKVTVRYLGRTVTLVTRGVAEADGAIGEELSVRSEHGSGVFAAIVSGADEVTIHE